MAGLFDDVPDAAPQAYAPSGGRAAPAPAASRGGLFDDVPDAKASGPSVVGDVVQGAGAGIIRGAAGLVDLPQNIYALADAGMGGLAHLAAKGIGAVIGVTPNSDLGRDTGMRGSLPSPADLPHPGDVALRGLEAATGPLYKPQTTAGEYAGTIAEFVPGGVGAKALEAGAAGAAKAFGKQVVAPAVASETAGQVTKGTAAEPWARGAAALATGAGVAIAGRPGAAERMFDRAAGKITPDEVTATQALVSDAAERGVALTWPEALQQVVGPRRMGDLQRVVEGQGGLSEFFAARPDQIQAAGKAGLDAIAPATTNPTRLGADVQAAARAGVAGTAEGQGVIRATQGAGPRVSPEQAGQVIQRDLRATADAREATRTEQAARDYAAARAAPENVGVERTITVERPGEPIETQPAYSRPQFEADAPLPADPAPRRSAATEADAQGESLARFIARNGGLDLTSDLKSQDFHRFNIPGAGTVAREGGKPLDSFWRVKLMEAGYLRPDADGGMARDIRGELMRKLTNERRGVPSYPIGQERAPLGERLKAGQIADDYGHARDLAESRLNEDLTRVGVDPESVHPDIRDRVLGTLMRDGNADPVEAYEAVVGKMKGPLEPYTKTPTVTEEIPDVRFGQVNPQAALDAIDGQLRTAKGDVRGALAQARKDLFGPGGETDLSVEGLLHARERLDTAIQGAREVGDNTKVRDLQIARSTLDGQLKGVPEVATADRNFAGNSRAVEPFTGNTPLGRVVQRDPLTQRMATPAEQVPTHLQGATAAREFLANATPTARRAFSDREVTRILDEVGSGEGGISAGALRTAMRRNEDLLVQLPEARGRLQRLALAHQAREAIERSPLGRIAARPDVKAAADVLFPIGKTVEGSADEVGQAVTAISRSNPLAARQLVRNYLGTQFAAKTERLQSGPNQAGGAKFATAIRGDSLQNDSLRAAIQALPNGAALDAGFSRLLDILEATGQRQGVGSRTSFNNEALAEMRNGGAKVEGAKVLASGGLGYPKRVVEALQNWQLGKNLDRLAELMTSAEGGRRLAQLATAKPGAATIALLDRMTRLGIRGAQGGDRSDGSALQLRVRPAE
ncbi:hypothetical protein MKK70_21190 [Methylobacterium sp. E-041]|uniref:hypothetical protein n=1 Tax=Methylobacterium sp. E-041 TaxID=2836573 RepID=UPI001FB8FCE4|nr:hypothetical protein [Methylobacterium sp. E-041]MCJ2107845.1 hypothetical protein [Methylobacterium sp. E-041]